VLIAGNILITVVNHLASQTLNTYHSVVF